MMLEHTAQKTSVQLRPAHERAFDAELAIATYTPDGVLRSATAPFLALLACTAQDAVGSHHRHWCAPGTLASTDYDALWRGLRNGCTQESSTVERQRLDKRPCWIRSTYVPVRDAAEQVIEVLEIATDATADKQREYAWQSQLRRLALAADATDSAIVVSLTGVRIVYVNAGFTRMLGWHADEVLGKDAIRVLQADQDPEALAQFQTTLRAEHHAERERNIEGKDGQRYWVRVKSQAIVDEHDGQPYTITVLSDISHAKLHEALQHRVLEAMARERPLTEVLELICRQVEHLAPEVSATILEVDAQRCLRALAAPSLPVSYSRSIDGVAIGPGVGSCGTAAWRNEAVMVEDIATDPLWAPYRELVLPLGFTSCWSTPIRSSQGGVLGTFAFYFRQARNKASAAFHQRLVDTCTHLCALALQRERTRQHIRQLAFYDTLTGLPNRSLLHAKADQAIAAAARDNEPLAVLFVDLDRFKQVNDSMGHPTGDAVLRHAATQLQVELRNSDIAGRLSGDEFAVVLPQCDADHATVIAERLQVLLATPLPIPGAALSLTASIGAAMYPTDGRDMDTLLQRADMAMYQAKSGGRGRFRFFSAEMNQLAQERLALESALREAIAERHLQLHYQPQVDMGSGRLYGVEALARWTHPTLGQIPPSRFIPMAEEAGLVAEFGNWALDEACRQLAQWRAAGWEVPGVSVNLSPISFHNLDLASSISATLSRHGLAPHDLTLELTESVLLDTNPSTMTTIADVDALGVRLAMDDFGTGYSSLSYLRRLPVNELKLDRSFVADLEGDETARALSSAIIGIGRSLGLTVVAEGVETPAQQALLQTLGYPIAQGYLYGRPMSGAHFAEWLAQRPAAPAH
jgi:diguanylate cyclase (GGDEF)-like protein/PAS domain S-box-containing protein